MKINKKTSFLSLFLAGTLVLSVSAAADVIIGDGYNSAKQALKYTSKTLANEADNFTINADFQIFVDGEQVSYEHSERKFDFVNNRTEETSERKNGDSGSFTNYYYRDSEKSINNFGDEPYYVYTNDSSTDSDETRLGLTDPFDEPIAQDIEKIADAFVSNMKDFVQVKDLDDGGKMYFGNLESAQIPALANALSSFALKYTVVESVRGMDVIDIKDCIALGEVSAQVSQNADGLLDSGVGTMSATGTDKDGNSHRIEMAVSVTVSDINTTVVEPVSFDGKDVVYGESGHDRWTITAKNIGRYSAPVVIEENDKLVKKSDNILIIDSVDGNTITGHMTIDDGNERVDSDYTAVKDDEYFDGYKAEYTDAEGNTKNARICLVNWSREQDLIYISVDLDTVTVTDGGYETRGDSCMMQMQLD